MLLLAKQTGDYRSAGWRGQIINHNYLQLIHFQAVQNKQPGPLEELTVSLQVACGSFGNDLNTQGDKRRGGESAWVMVGLWAPLPPDWRGGGWKHAWWHGCWLHAGTSGAFVLFHPITSLTRLPFMYPDGVHFDPLFSAPSSLLQPPIHCMPAGVFPLSFSSVACTDSAFTHIIVSRHMIALTSALSALFTAIIICAKYLDYTQKWFSCCCLGSKSPKSKYLAYFFSFQTK